MLTSAGEPRIRQSKRERITKFFFANVGKRHDTYHLHGMFGPAFRARVSEINRDSSSPIRILNQTISMDSEERSVYWAELRAERSLFGDLRLEHRDDG